MCLHTHTPLIQDNTMHQHHPCASGPNSPNSPRRKEQTAEIQAEVVEEAQSVLAQVEQKLKRAAEVFAINSKQEKGVCTSSHTQLSQVISLSEAHCPF